MRSNRIWKEFISKYWEIIMRKNNKWEQIIKDLVSHKWIIDNNPQTILKSTIEISLVHLKRYKVRVIVISERWWVITEIKRLLKISVISLVTLLN